MIAMLSTCQCTIHGKNFSHEYEGYTSYFPLFRGIRMMHHYTYNNIYDCIVKINYIL